MPQECSANIRAYMRDRLSIAPNEVEELCLQFYLDYGTTLAGLVAHGYKIDYDDWHAHVHGTLPYERHLKRDVKLQRILDSIPISKYVFTNADRRHAQRCLALLGLQSCFDGIICFEDVMEAAAERGLIHHGRPVVCKPNRQAMEIALRLAGGADAASTVFFDDSTRNVTSGVKSGVFSVLVGRTGVDCTADLQLKSMHDLPLALPWLWAAGVPDQSRELSQEEAAGGTIGTAICVQA
ncbi:hypothetical protein N2152v2_003153 [Parachlorella kessleri]